MTNSIESLKDQVVCEIKELLDSIGLMYRIFDRAKSSKSLKRKLASNPDYGSGKLIQDIIGIRVVLYFTDDVQIVRDAMKSLFEERVEDQSIDEPGTSDFQARRYNLVFGYDDEGWDEITAAFDGKIDRTFELQIRTVFSEGWHEVEHDLKYKFKEDWDAVPEFTRSMNGVLASLEINEVMMLRILDDLAYSHYKSGKVIEMFRQKLRLKLGMFDLSDDLITTLSESELLKRFHRVSRKDLLAEMVRSKFRYPLTLENVIYFANFVFLNDPRITALTPAFMIEELDEVIGGRRGVSNVVDAEKIALEAHEGQTRRDGKPYITHPAAVVEMLTNPDEVSVAWLHDVLEDTKIDEKFLRDAGIDDSVIEAVVLLTKDSEISYEDYITKISRNSLARRVKICDIIHNLSDSPKSEKVDVYLSSLKKLQAAS